MPILRFILPIIICHFFLPFSHSQSNIMEVGEKYSMGKVYFKNNRIVRTGKIHLENDTTLVFTAQNAVATNSVFSSEVKFVKLKVGNNAVKYGAFGAGFMALSSLLALANIASDPYTETKSNAGAIVGGFIAGGAAVGALIGVASPKWKTFYIKPKSSSPSTSFIVPTVDPFSRSYQLNFIVSF